MNVLAFCEFVNFLVCKSKPLHARRYSVNEKTRVCLLRNHYVKNSRTARALNVCSAAARARVRHSRTTFGKQLHGLQYLCVKRRLDSEGNIIFGPAEHSLLSIHALHGLLVEVVPTDPLMQYVAIIRIYVDNVKVNEHRFLVCGPTSCYVPCIHTSTLFPLVSLTWPHLSLHILYKYIDENGTTKYVGASSTDAVEEYFTVFGVHFTDKAQHSFVKAQFVGPQFAIVCNDSISQDCYAVLKWYHGNLTYAMLNGQELNHMSESDARRAFSHLREHLCSARTLQQIKN